MLNGLKKNSLKVYEEIDLNDILWFDTDWCCQCLGFEDYEDFLETL